MSAETYFTIYWTVDEVAEEVTFQVCCTQASSDMCTGVRMSAMWRRSGVALACRRSPSNHRILAIASTFHAEVDRPMTLVLSRV